MPFPLLQRAVHAFSHLLHLRTTRKTTKKAYLFYWTTLTSWRQSEILLWLLSNAFWVCSLLGSLLLSRCCPLNCLEHRKGAIPLSGSLGTSLPENVSCRSAQLRSSQWNGQFRQLFSDDRVCRITQLKGVRAPTCFAGQRMECKSLVQMAALPESTKWPSRTNEGHFLTLREAFVRISSLKWCLYGACEHPQTIVHGYDPLLFRKKPESYGMGVSISTSETHIQGSHPLWRGGLE